MKYTCGVDWASDHHDASIVNERGMEVKQLRIDDDMDGYRKLLNALEELGGDIPIAIECKEHLLTSYLASEGYSVYPINPKSAERYKDRYNVGGTKTDPVDAFSLADILRTDSHKHRPLAFSSEEVRKLQLLCMEYDKLLKDKNTLEYQLQDVLGKYFPLALTLFYKKSCKILYRMLAVYPTYSQLKAAGYEELKTFLLGNRYLLTKNIRSIHRKIQQSDYHHVDVFDEVFSHTAKALAGALLVLTEQVDKLKSKMTTITKSHKLAGVFYSLPGSGDVNSARLLALMGDNMELYSDPSEVQAFGGVAPVIKSSGKKFRVVFRYACNKTHRDTLTWFAFCSLPYCPWAREFYDRKKKEGKGHYEACRLLAFKWVRIIFKLWKNGESYNTQHHLKNLEKFRERRLKIA